jgi:hypothetical protein
VKVVRTGVTRTVILTGRYAIKVPSLRGGSSGARIESFCWGVLANRSEREWHDYAGWGGHVAPVLRSWLGGIVQVYPRCLPLPPGARGPLPCLDPDPGDFKPDNFGVLGGRVVWIDYDMR